MKIADMMRTNLLKVGPEATVLSVLRLYKDQSTTSRLTYVVDAADRLLGVVTIFDLLQLVLPDVVASAGFYTKIASEDLALQYLVKSIGYSRDRSVRGIMRTGVETVGPDDLFVKAHKLLVRKEVTAMPVVDASGRLVGEMTRRIIIKYIADRV